MFTFLILVFLVLRSLTPLSVCAGPLTEPDKNCTLDQSVCVGDHVFVLAEGMWRQPTSYKVTEIYDFNDTLGVTNLSGNKYLTVPRDHVGATHLDVCTKTIPVYCVGDALQRIKRSKEQLMLDMKSRFPNEKEENLNLLVRLEMENESSDDPRPQVGIVLGIFPHDEILVTYKGSHPRLLAEDTIKVLLKSEPAVLDFPQLHTDNYITLHNYGHILELSNPLEMDDFISVKPTPALGNIDYPRSKTTFFKRVFRRLQHEF